MSVDNLDISVPDPETDTDEGYGDEEALADVRHDPLNVSRVTTLVAELKKPPPGCPRQAKGPPGEELGEVEEPDDDDPDYHGPDEYLEGFDNDDGDGQPV